MTGRMMSGLTVVTMLTILFLSGLAVARFRVERAAAPNPPSSVVVPAMSAWVAVRRRVLHVTLLLDLPAAPR